MDSRYGFVFNFGDGGWNIIMFNSNGENHAYYSCDEDDYEYALQHLEDYVHLKNIYKYNIPTYAEFCEKVEDIFSLKNKPIEACSDYITV